MKPPLAERQTALRIRSAELRLEMAMQARALERPFAAADRIQEGWRWLRGHREWLWAAGGLLALLRPRRALKLAGRGWLGWRTLRRWQPWISTALPAVLAALRQRDAPPPGGPTP